MPYLYKTKEIILEKLIVAKDLKDRTIGLLKYDQISNDQGLWILNCKSIHTFFMKFAIDVVFIDKQMKIVSVAENVNPFRVLYPRWSADSVIETNVGFIKKWKLEIGEVLRVVN
jgi:uncharacterized membrane protein (UPF0127 family)